MLQSFNVDFPLSPPASKAKQTPRRKVAAAKTETHSRVDTTPQSPTTPTKAAAPAPTPASPEPPAQPVQQQALPRTPAIPGTEELIQKEAILYLWDASQGQFENQGVLMASIVKRPDEPFSFYLTAHNDERLLLTHLISSNMNPKWTHRMLSITWNMLNADNTGGTSWCFRFASEEDYTVMAEMFVRCLWETLHQTPWEKIKQDEQRYVMSSNEDVEMKDVSDEEDEEGEVLEELEVDKGTTHRIILLSPPFLHVD